MKQTIIFALIFILDSITLTLAKDDLDIVKKLKSQGLAIKYINDNTSLLELAKSLKDKKENLYYLDLNDYIELLKRWNQHVDNFSYLKGEYIYTESPSAPHLSYEYIPPLPQNINKTKRDVASILSPTATLIKKNTLEYQEIFARKYTFFAHVTLSQGNFIEQVNSSSLENQQNSPLTIGAGTHIKINPTISLTSSLYLSRLNASTINSSKANNNEVAQIQLDIKDELGSNVYLQYKLQNYGYSIYGGFDYEQFTTLNLNEIIQGNSDVISVAREKMIFTTFGISFLKKIILPTTIKLSLSPVISSNTDFSGLKYMLYMNQKITNQTWYHLLIKHHHLEQANRAVSITRYGMGVGVTF